MRTALDIVGGADSLYQTISCGIYEQRISSGMMPEELGVMAGMANPRQVAELESRQVSADKFAVSDVLAILAQLGVSVERVVKLQQLSEQEKNDWDAELEKAAAGPLASANGEIDPSETRSLFIRFKALEELFTRPADTSIPARK